MFQRLCKYVVVCTNILSTKVQRLMGKYALSLVGRLKGLTWTCERHGLSKQRVNVEDMAEVVYIAVQGWSRLCVSVTGPEKARVRRVAFLCTVHFGKELGTSFVVRFPRSSNLTANHWYSITVFPSTDTMSNSSSSNLYGPSLWRRWQLVTGITDERVGTRKDVDANARTV